MDVQKEVDHKITELEKTGKSFSVREKAIALLFFSAGVTSMAEESKIIIRGK